MFRDFSLYTFVLIATYELSFEKQHTSSKLSERIAKALEWYKNSRYDVDIIGIGL